MGEGAETPASMASRRGIGVRHRRYRQPRRSGGFRGDSPRLYRRAVARGRARRAARFKEVAHFSRSCVATSVLMHASSERELGDRLGEGRQRACAYRSLLDAGASPANWLDAPVAELDPLRGIVAGVLRIIDERAPSGAGTRGRRGAAGHGRLSGLARARGASPGWWRPGCSPIWWCSTAISLPVPERGRRERSIHRVKDLTS
jgi:hypothetical protein